MEVSGVHGVDFFVETDCFFDFIFQFISHFDDSEGFFILLYDSGQLDFLDSVEVVGCYVKGMKDLLVGLDS